MPQPRKFDHDDARRRYENGETIGGLARDYGVSDEAVSQAIKRAGGTVTRRAGATAKHPPPAAIVAPPAPPPPASCSHTQCTEPATRKVTFGDMKHHLALSGPGTAKLGAGGAPVCTHCWSVATGRYPCTTRGCAGSSTIDGQACAACLGAERPTEAAPPRSTSSSVFPSGPFPGPPSRALSMPIVPPTLDRQERARLERIATPSDRAKYDAERKNGTDAQARAANERHVLPQADATSETVEAPVAPPLTYDPQAVVELRDQGYTHRAIGERLGISKSAVQRAIAAHERNTEPESQKAKPQVEPEITTETEPQAELDEFDQARADHNLPPLGEQPRTTISFDFLTDPEVRRRLGEALDRVRATAPQKTLEQQDADRVRCTAILAPGGWRVEYRAPDLVLELDVPTWQGVERVLVEVLKRS